MLGLRSSFILFAAISVEGNDGFIGVEAGNDHQSAAICNGDADLSAPACLLQLKAVSDAERHSSKHSGRKRRQRRGRGGVNRTHRARVGVLVPSSLKGVAWTDEEVLAQFSLFTILLPSLQKTVETTKYEYHVYVGIDAGDRLARFKTEIAAWTAPGMTVVPVVVPGSDSFNKAVNYIAEKAYDAGEDYMCRVNDDTEFVTAAWTTIAVDGLASMSPSNVGVVGPTCPNGKQGIITHDFVHRNHFDMFGFYYPAVFKNWCTDDWMTQVYGGLGAEHSRTRMLVKWEVVHHCDINTRPETTNLSPGQINCMKPRYEIGLLQSDAVLLQRLGCDELDSAVEEGKERISVVLAEAASSS